MSPFLFRKTVDNWVSKFYNPLKESWVGLRKKKSLELSWVGRVKRYDGINHELLLDVVCDLFRLYRFNVECTSEKYMAGEKSALKVHIYGKKKTGWFSSQAVEASIIGQLDAETVLHVWATPHPTPKPL